MAWVAFWMVCGLFLVCITVDSMYTSYCKTKTLLNKDK